MYRDGICKVKKNYYTKMIEFHDLNYVLLDEEERADILALYSQLINYFDPSIRFQIFLFNRHVNEETLSAQFEHSLAVTKDGCEVFTYSPKGLDKPPYNL